MKDLVDLLKTNLWQALTAIFFFAFVMKGCTNNKLTQIDKKYSENTIRLESKLDSLQMQLAKYATAKEVRDEMEVVMFNYLIYEDDLDKGKSSLSDIKNKIEAND
jgi:hypothetical protein